MSNIREGAVLALCVLASFILMFTSEKDPGGPFRVLFNNTIGNFGQSVYEMTSYFRMEELVTRLETENNRLALKNLQMQDALLENIRLRQMLELRDRMNLEMVAAEVVGENPQNILNGLLLNEGQGRGIEKNVAVINADGLVGRIVRVDNDNSICEILLDRNSRVSAQIQRNRELGIIAWEGGQVLKLLYVSKTIQVLVGDVIITSGRSDIFPENIKIGIVVDVSLDTEGLFQEISVKPSVSYSRLEEVFVVTGGGR
jgi:rod shape-determining protein MreC